MTISEHITQTLKQQGRTKVWLAEQLGVTKQVMNYKLTNNRITADELVSIGKLLGMNLNELKEE